MINLHVFGDFDFRPIFGGFLEGLGTSKLVIFSYFFAFFTMQISKIFFEQQKIRFWKKVL